MQIIVAGKAHPDDEEGKRLVQAWAEFVRRPSVRRRAVFLEDYDMSLAQEMVQGVDVWINTPRRPWEACGTSGMKLLVNGGLNLSELDGWWAEAHRPDVGWALGDAKVHASPEQDVADAEQLYRLLEDEIVPAFFARDAHGIPRAWIARIRASMSLLAPEFSSNRMMRDYVERCYLPAATAFRLRTARGAKLARELESWWRLIERHWSEVHFGTVTAVQNGDRWDFAAEVHLGPLLAAMVQVELYADAVDGGPTVRVVMRPDAGPSGETGTSIYRASVSSSRPSGTSLPASSRTIRTPAFPSRPHSSPGRDKCGSLRASGPACPQPAAPSRQRQRRLRRSAPRSSRRAQSPSRYHP